MIGQGELRTVHSSHRGGGGGEHKRKLFVPPPGDIIPLYLLFGETTSHLPVSEGELFNISKTNNKL